MEKKSGLPNGFVTVEEAVELIKTNTFNVPTVDIKYLAKSLYWVEVAHNFRIPKVRLITQDEYKAALEKRPGKRPKELIKKGSVTVTVRTAYEAELLKKTIKDNYRETAGKEYQPQITRGISTVADQDMGSDVTPRASKKTIAKEGSIIGTGATSTTNSADSAGI